MIDRERLALRAVNEANSAGASVADLLRIYREVQSGRDPQEALARLKEQRAE